MSRKTDSHNPADWLLFAKSDLECLRILVAQQIGYTLCRSKLAEVVEKIMKAELIRIGWSLEKTHDLEKLLGELNFRHSDLTPRLEPLCEELTEAYFTGRYPGFDLEDEDWPALRAQLDQVSEVFDTVKVRVASK